MCFRFARARFQKNEEFRKHLLFDLCYIVSVTGSHKKLSCNLQYY